LDILLTKAGISGPYVLVGHSFGGLNMMLYASQHRDQVVGMVLVDSSHEDQRLRFASLMPPEERDAYIEAHKWNPEQVDIVTSEAQVRAAGPLPDIPLIVLTAQEAEGATDDPHAQAWYEMQVDLARRVPHGRQIIVEHCSHFIQNDRPEVVIEAIRTVVEETRQGSPASSPADRTGYSEIVVIAVAGVFVLGGTALLVERGIVRLW